MLLSALAGGASPHSSASRWSVETIAFGCWSRIANSERCLTPPSATARPPSLISRGPRMRKSIGALADSTVLRYTPPAQGDGLPSAGLWIPGVDRQLGGEGPFVRGPRFAAGNVGGQFRELVQKARRSQPEQHRHHHQIARAERPIEPVGITQASRELDQSIANTVLDQRQALL